VERLKFEVIVSQVKIIPTCVYMYMLKVMLPVFMEAKTCRIHAKA